jgi:alkylation response protein AidB-like acyl-CoA dehydrogenase
MAIDFTLSPEQQALQADARGFAAAVLSEVRGLIDPLSRPEDRFFATQPIYAQMAKAGFVHALFPAEYGGGGMSTVNFAIAAEELTRVDINVPTTLLAVGLGMEPILGFGSAEQKRHWVGEILAEPENRLASFAFTEVAGGANFDCPDPAAGVQTHARLEGDEWVINGQKHFTTNGSGWDGNGAHLYTVVCRTDLSKPPAESLAVIVVPGATPGVDVVGYLDTAGHRAVASPRVHFTDVRVPAGNILGKPGDGQAICRRSFSWTAALIGSACVGVMRAAFEEALAFAKTDKRSGNVPVIEHQNAGYMLADLKMRIEAARYLTWKACHQLDHTERASDELAIMTKVYCSELAVQVVYDAMRLVGVNSYSDLSPLSGLMQDALCFPLYDGGNMGVRRRQLHTMMKSSGYDPMAAAEAR